MLTMFLMMMTTTESSRIQTGGPRTWYPADSRALYMVNLAQRQGPQFAIDNPINNKSSPETPGSIHSSTCRHK